MMTFGIMSAGGLFFLNIFSSKPNWPFNSFSNKTTKSTIKQWYETIHNAVDNNKTLRLSLTQLFTSQATFNWFNKTIDLQYSDHMHYNQESKSETHFADEFLSRVERTYNKVNSNATSNTPYTSFQETYNEMIDQARANMTCSSFLIALCLRHELNVYRRHHDEVTWINSFLSDKISRLELINLMEAIHKPSVEEMRGIMRQHSQITRINYTTYELSGFLETKLDEYYRTISDQAFLKFLACVKGKATTRTSDVNPDNTKRGCITVNIVEKSSPMGETKFASTRPYATFQTCSSKMTITCHDNLMLTWSQDRFNRWLNTQVERAMTFSGFKEKL